MTLPRRYRLAGFSLVELLIALVFVSFMMAGMLRIYGASIQGFNAANESAKAQRDNRWAVQNLYDDLSAAGFQFPGTTSPLQPSVSSGGQNAVMIIPKTISIYVPDPSNPTATPTKEDLTFDEIQLFTDQVLPVAAHLTNPSTPGASVDLALTEGDFSLVKPGDVMIMLDASLLLAYDSATISLTPNSGTTGTVALGGGGAVADGGYVSATSGALTRSHPVGAEALIIRTGQVLRYTLLPLALDPSNPAVRVPCLVRDQGPYPASGSLINWPTETATASQLAAAGVTRTIVAENVTNLRFDISADQGKTWVRSGSWASTLSNLNSALASLAAANPTLNYVTSAQDSSHPRWYRTDPVLFRADVTTRTLLKRADYSAVVNTATYRTRTQTLMVQPRNFGLGE